MATTDHIRSEIFEQIKKLLDDVSRDVNDDMPLIGGDSTLDSMKLVELCLALEDMATSKGFEFDWTSDSAMSKSRSMFRTAGTLATEFITQMETTK